MGWNPARRRPGKKWLELFQKKKFHVKMVVTLPEEEFPVERG